MTVESRPIQRPASDIATTSSLSRVARAATTVIRRPIFQNLQTAQLGPLPDATLGRHMGGRI